jgi:predicted ATPase
MHKTGVSFLWETPVFWRFFVGFLGSKNRHSQFIVVTQTKILLYSLETCAIMNIFREENPKLITAFSLIWQNEGNPSKINYFRRQLP